MKQKGRRFFEVDKKSMMKVLIALERQGLIRVYNKEVGEEKVTGREIFFKNNIVIRKVPKW